MKPCKPIYSHIDEDEIGTGRIITSSLLQRYCTNIAALKRDVEKLEEHSLPEMKKTYHPPPIHSQHSYGVKLNTEKGGYTFNNETRHTFNDSLFQMEASILQLQKEENSTIFSKKLEQKIDILELKRNYIETGYKHVTNKKELENTDNAYCIEDDTLHVKTVANEDTIDVIVMVGSPSTYLDLENTTAYINIAKKAITPPLLKSPYTAEELDTQAELLMPEELKKFLQIPISEGLEISKYVGIQKYWTIGWTDNQPHWASPSWLADPFNENPSTTLIPTTLQAFTIQTTRTGLLTKIQLQLLANPHAEDSLYCEIRPTHQDGTPTTEVLCREKIYKNQLKNPEEGDYNTPTTIEFKAPPLLKEGTVYAVVLRSPFTSSQHSYQIGGYKNQKIGSWKTTTETKVETKIFESSNNGLTWTQRPTTELYYHVTYIKPLKETDKYEPGVYYVYWKPIYTNPLKSVQLIPSSQNYDGNVEWEISIDRQKWHTLKGSNWDYTFQEKDKTFRDEDEKTLYIRAKITHPSNKDKSAEITGLKVIMETSPAKEAYLKTLFHQPTKIHPMNTPSWSQIGTTIQKDNALVYIDIIQNKIQKDTITLKKGETRYLLTNTPSQPVIRVRYYPKYLQNIVNALGTVQLTEKNNIGEIIETITQTYENLLEARAKLPSKETPLNSDKKDELKKIINGLKGVIASQLTKNSASTEWKEAWTGISQKLNQIDSVETNGDAEKICTETELIIITIRSYLNKKLYTTPSFTDKKIQSILLMEDKDYTLDYTTKIIKLKRVLEDGYLEVEYYPVWIQNLKPEDFPLQLDHIKEETTKDNLSMLELKAVPLTELQKIRYRIDGINEWQELKYTEYTLHPLYKRINLHKTIPQLTTYQVIYTPDLIDDGLALTYKMQRSEYSQQVVIEDVYYQNRA